MVSPLGGSEYTDKNCLGFAEGEEWQSFSLKHGLTSLPNPMTQMSVVVIFSEWFV